MAQSEIYIIIITIHFLFIVTSLLKLQAGGRGVERISVYDYWTQVFHLWKIYVELSLNLCQSRKTDSIVSSLLPLQESTKIDFSATEQI